MSIAGIGDIEAQTRQVCENVKSAVEQAGGTMDDICRVDVYVRRRWVGAIDVLRKWCGGQRLRFEKTERTIRGWLQTAARYLA
jgi:enamine deaminase RidA (YjgF/YER057c/UK114 family)